MTDDLDKTIPPQRSAGNMFDMDKTMPGYRDRKTDGRFAVGDLIMGRYKVLAELGKGGMGIVYKCEDQTSHVCYAVKTLAPELTDSKWEMEEILYNFQLVQKLHHPNIANYNSLELDPQTNRYFLVMEYVEGEDLRYWLRSKRREGADLQQVIPPVVRQIAQALDYAHSQKIVHRDIKPGNIMIDGEGNVKVLDFGLAAQIHSSLSRVSIQSVNEASTCGTIPYMAPEQWRGGEAEAASDQYALAATVYEMFSGRPPFDSADKDILRNCTLHEAPRPLKDVSPAIRSAVEKALAKDPENRFNSCADFAAALGGAKVAKSKKVSSGKSGGAWKWIVFSILAVLLVAGGFFGIRYWQAKKAEEALLEQMVKKAEEQGLILSDDKYTVVGVKGNYDESIEIPDGIRYIGNEAFAYCKKLKSVTIPDSVRGIGASAFYDCDSLRSITIPDSVTSIGAKAFYDCNSLTGITIPDSVTSFGNEAFYGCDSLTSITIPDSVTSIGAHAFQYCSSLKSITLGNSVTSIGNEAFHGCSSLKSITLGNSVTSIGGSAFRFCVSLTSITIPGSVTSIGYKAFYGCDSLTSITIPSHFTDADVKEWRKPSGCEIIRK